MLEKLYTNLARLNQELSESYEKITKKKNKTYKFFTQVWKGVKGLWKVLTLRDPLPSFSQVKEDDVSAYCSKDDDDDVAEQMVETDND